MKLVSQERYLSMIRVIWLLLGGDCTMAVARQRPTDRIIFSAQSAKQFLNSNRETVFSLRSVQRCCTLQFILMGA
jgi:hypothetical protein